MLRHAAQISSRIPLRCIETTSLFTYSSLTPFPDYVDDSGQEISRDEAFARARSRHHKHRDCRQGCCNASPARVSRDTIILFPPSLDEYIAPDNSVRFIDAFVDQLD